MRLTKVEFAKRFACPRCGSPPMRACSRARGKGARDQQHWQRHELAIVNGYPVVREIERTVRTKAGRLPVGGDSP